MTANPRPFAPVDLAIAAALAALALGFVPLSRANAPSTVVVYRGNQTVAVYPLDQTATTTIEGARGAVEITIRDRTARITAADCPHRVCMATGSVSRPGQQLVCAPNHILVQIESRSGNAPDAITR